MPTLVDKLCHRLYQARHATGIRAKLITSWIDDPLPLSAWETWTLLFLVRHRTRQQFVADTVNLRLSGEPRKLATAMAMGHPDRAQKGVVPGLSEWEYYFHGRGCCLTHRVSGEAIDVDFYDETADWFDDFFLICYLQSLSQPMFVEQRLISLHESYEPIRLALERLCQTDLLEQHHESTVVRLTFNHEQLNECIADLEPIWQETTTQANCRLRLQRLANARKTVPWSFAR